ncbi:MAG: hypothetical protein J1E39_03015 [Eubacterium sp.]|nr:hypothetical protein [Eubacterium sp.]
MITILNTSDKPDALLFEAKDGEEVLGTLTGRFEDGLFIISGISSEKFLIDGLCRAAMNYAYNRVINSCRFDIEDGEIKSELIRLGFVKNDDNYIPDIDYFFTSHKTCGK